ncbi:MAG TPA: SGNH/GDSL hydrolase family protein, partial [Phycisphaerae bacterium]|nr:SGNH/GDSL hydrolase family protein [Phycisphaerae bacterium]
RFEIVPPVEGWRDPCRQILRTSGRSGGPVFLGDELAAACAPASEQGRSHGNSPGWRLPDVWAALDTVLARCDPHCAVLLIGGADLPTGHPERTDFEANYTMLIRRLISAGCLPIPATLPPCSHLEPFAWMYNAVIAQAACLHRLPLIDLCERMRPGFTPIHNEPADAKTPRPESIAANRFAEGHAPIVAADLREILDKLDA